MIPTRLRVTVVLALCAATVVSGASPAGGAPPDAVAHAAVRRVERFWKGAFRHLSRRRFEPLAGGVVAVHRHEDPPDCGDVEITRRALRGNALYCPSDDRIVFDADGFARRLVHDDGPGALTLVIAHEVGHAIQHRLRARLDRLVGENQADCYAGAYSASRAAGRQSTRWITESLLGLLALADPPGADPARGAAHGTGFDRVAAFLDGRAHGVERCARLASSPRPTTSELFLGAADRARHGNLELPSISLAMQRDLNDQYRVVADQLHAAWTPLTITLQQGPPSCSGGPPATVSSVWCGNDTVILSRDGAARLDRIGDLAVGAAIGRAWAVAAEHRFGTVFAGDQATTECLTGVWLGTTFPRAKVRPSRTIQLSPGDLDEVVRGILVDDQAPDPIARLTALQDGFYGGIGRCTRQVTTAPAS